MKFLLSIFLILIGCCGAAQTVPLTVISNTKGAPDQLRTSELVAILKGEKQRWHNGNKILIALMKTNTAIGKSTSEKVYDMTADELKKYWLALVFQGKAEAPVFFNTTTELQAFVAENPGAIGVVDQLEPATATHVVLVDGKKTF